MCFKFKEIGIISDMQNETVINPKVRFFEVEDGFEGQRLDNFLLARLKGLPRSRLYRLLRKGEIRVNKKRVKPAYRVAIADSIRVAPIRLAPETGPAKLPQKQQEMLQQAIIYEDDGLIALNKPSGIAVHGGSGIRAGVIEGLRNLYPNNKQLELVHRLDRDTSGILLLAKKRKVLKALHQGLRENRLQKYYLCLVHGHWPKHLARVDAPLQKNILHSGERMVSVNAEGKASRTDFKVLSRFNNASLVLAKPITGRTHQIRVHARHAGHSIIGDTKYTDNQVNKLWHDDGIKRLWLHAVQLQVPEQLWPDAPALNLHASPPDELLAPIADHIGDWQARLTDLLDRH